MTCKKLFLIQLLYEYVLCNKYSTGINLSLTNKTFRLASLGYTYPIFSLWFNSEFKNIGSVCFNRNIVKCHIAAPSTWNAA